jgi:hypothetical protein
MEGVTTTQCAPSTESSKNACHLSVFRKNVRKVNTVLFTFPLTPGQRLLIIGGRSFRWEDDLGIRVAVFVELTLTTTDGIR